MNIFEQYGIKEVADVTLYAIELDENDDEVYVPVMYLDTLKVSSIEETAEQTSARGGLGNPELIIWDYGKEITVTLEDALYTPASQGMTWGGKMGIKNFCLYGIYTYENGATENARVKISSISDFKINQSPKAYVWTVNINLISSRGNRIVKENYILNYITEGDKLGWVFGTGQGASETLTFGDGSSFTIDNTLNNATAAQELIYQIDHGLNNVDFFERTEKCKATQTFVINTDVNTTHGNYRYLEKYSQQELTVFIDPRTMQPYEPNTDSFTRKNGETITGNLRVIKQHEIYYKWTRTKAADNTSLGHQIIINATKFPGTYRLVGETYSRNRKTGKDQRFQFEIPLCKMGTENSFTFEAEGEPTTFNMTLKVLRREDGVMMKLTQYDVETAKYDKYLSGSTKVLTNAKVLPEENFEI